MRNTCFIILLILAMVFVCSCGRNKDYNLNPDDELSRSVQEMLGEEFYYHGKGDTELYGTCYEYQIKNKNAEAISKFIKIISKCMEDERRKISVYVYSDIPGGLECVFSLTNYAKKDEEIGDIMEGCFLYVSNLRVVSDDIYYDPFTYSNIEGVSIMSIPNQMDENAKTAGIDWYSDCPNLEEVIVRE
ncbi:MAG: hypothetical protein NC081_04780 [Roseburia sp.]|nr:hypothetical protein [Roseburia sp.]